MQNLPREDIDCLSPPERLALAYATRRGRAVWEAFFLFERRLAETARPGREPLMVQLRLAWWRDRLAEPVERWPVSEPTLARLHAWGEHRSHLSGLVDGWEASVVGEDGGAALSAARVDAFVALAALVGETSLDDVRRAAQDLVSPSEATGRSPRLSRAMRPLIVLRGLAVRSAQGRPATPLADMAHVIRIGLLGR